MSFFMMGTIKIIRTELKIGIAGTDVVEATHKPFNSERDTCKPTEHNNTTNQITLYPWPIA